MTDGKSDEDTPWYLDRRKLHPLETSWVARYELLKNHGYLLRPRYRPGWTPSWPASERDPEFYYEDSLLLLHSKRLDANRVSDGKPVFLKLIPRSSPEIEIGRLLASPALQNDPRNHCIPVLDILDDPVHGDGAILVLPLLRQIDRPPPATMQEFTSLVEQTLEALVFLHENEIAHRDCAFDNIMMDARALYPEGWHPQFPFRVSDFKRALPSRAIREADHISYYFVDFGLSTYKECLTTGVDGQERAPELSDHVPYDPYMLDVYILGMAYKRFFESIYRASDFKPLQPLTDFMTPVDPAARPSARAAHDRFKEILAEIPKDELTGRLIPLDGETTSERIWNDIDHFLRTWLSRWTSKRTSEPLV